MKTLMTMLVAGAMLASAAHANSADPMADERFRAKYGRYTPAEETRRHAVEQAKQEANSCEHGCCEQTPGSKADTASKAEENQWATEYVRAKLGRTAENLTSSTVARNRVPVTRNDGAERLNAKLGITPEGVFPHPQQPKANTQQLLAAVRAMMCEMPCCDRESAN